MPSPSETNERMEAAAVSPEVMREMLAALYDADTALTHSEPRLSHYPEPTSRHLSAVLRVRRAIALAEGQSAIAAAFEAAIAKARAS